MRSSARLTATGLPCLLPCRLSGLALLDAPKTGWSLILQHDGQQLAGPLTGDVLAELKPLFQEALRRPRLLVTMTDREIASSRRPPSIARLGVQCLAVAPLMTLRSRLGLLLIGRESPETFSREDEMVLTALGGLLALGIENTRLYQRLQQLGRHIDQAYHVGLVVTRGGSTRATHSHLNRFRLNMAPGFHTGLDGLLPFIQVEEMRPAPP